MTDALIGYDSKYEIDTGSGFVEVAEVTSITPGEATTDRVDATHMKSPGRRREYIAGLIDNGEASFDINWVPGSTTDEMLRAIQTAGSSDQHRITFPNGVTCTFEAVITGFSKAVPLDDKMTATLTVAVSGEEEWA